MPTSRDLGAVARLAASQHGVVTRSQAAELELSRKAVAALVQRGFWEEIHPGLLVLVSAPDTWRRRVELAVQARRGTPVVSHQAAARLHRIEGFEESDVVVVTMERGQRRPPSKVVVHWVAAPIAARDLVTIDGVRCTSLARTLVDLAAVAPADALERALDDFERRGQRLAWLEQTAQRVHRPGQSGTRLILREVAARQARGQVRGSWFQKVLKDCLASPRIPGLVEEYEIRDGKRLIARVDLAVPLVRLGIEAHSRSFHTGAAAEARDERRDRAAAEVGWELQYFGFAETHQTPLDVCRSIERIVARRARDLGIVLPAGK